MTRAILTEVTGESLDVPSPAYVRVQDNRHWTIVVDLDQHHGPEPSCFDPTDPLAPEVLRELLDQWFCHFGLGRLGETRASPFPSIPVQGELRHHEGFAVHVQESS